MPHGALVEIVPDLFVVTATLRLALGAIAFPRNMTILRHQAELTLFNSVRLTSDGEKALAALGERSSRRPPGRVSWRRRRLLSRSLPT
jgi:hypothetical protein